MASILIFNEPNFGGSKLLVTANVPNLATIGWSGVASLIVIEGAWNLFQDASYQGNELSVYATGGSQGPNGQYTNGVYSDLNSPGTVASLQAMV